MPDISMCNNQNCPLKDKCYRFTATPNPRWQAYSGFMYDEQTNECNYFMDNDGKD